MNIRNCGQSWETAQSAWDDYEASRAQKDADRRVENPGITLQPRYGRAKSPTGGLGERVRAERAAMGMLTAAEAAKAKAKQIAKQKFLKDQAKKTLAANLSRYVWPADGSRYFPHQSTRECARRVRQATVRA